MEKTLKFAKVRDVKDPSRGTPLSAGVDFFVPNGMDAVALGPGESVNIPSGLRVRVPKGHALIMFNKSGVALRKGLQVGACVVDEDYQGEVHLHVTNVGASPCTISPGEKLVQGVLLPVCYAALEAVPTTGELFGGEATMRGEGGFGSTGSF